jgi:hypothetical protein
MGECEAGETIPTTNNKAGVPMKKRIVMIIASEPIMVVQA